MFDFFQLCAIHRILSTSSFVSFNHPCTYATPVFSCGSKASSYPDIVVDKSCIVMNLLHIGYEKMSRSIGTVFKTLNLVNVASSKAETSTLLPFPPIQKLEVYVHTVELVKS